MKATGIVRRIDELGRIVIPKEIRRTFKIKEGTPLEIFCGERDELILKKYSMLSELGDFAQDVCVSAFNTLNVPVLVCDKDKIIAVSGTNKSQFLHKNITTKLENIIENRKEVIKSNQDELSLIELKEQDDTNYYSQIIVPIICNGDTLGAIMCFTKEQKSLGQTELISLKMMANFISEQMQ